MCCAIRAVPSFSGGVLKTGYFYGYNIVITSFLIQALSQGKDRAMLCADR
jgi:hypothetical protein